MSIFWYSKTDKTCYATIYSSNITLNKSSLELINNAYKVKLGLDKEKKLIIISPLTKEQCDLNTIDETYLFNITFHSSYARIASTDFILFLSNEFNLDLNKKPKKFLASYDKKLQALIIDLGKEI